MVDGFGIIKYFERILSAVTLGANAIAIRHRLKCFLIDHFRVTRALLAFTLALEIVIVSFGGRNRLVSGDSSRLDRASVWVCVWPPPVSDMAIDYTTT